MNHNHRSDLQSKVTHNHRSQYRQIVNDRSGVMATSNDEENAAGNPEVGFEQPRRRSLEKQVRRSLDERVSKWDWCVFTWSVLWLMLWIGCLPQPLAMTKSRKLLFIVKGNPALAYPFKSSIPPLTSPLKCGVTCTVSSGFLPHFQISYNGEKIDHEKSRYPNSIVWTPIPLLSWIFPFIGHMGIAMTNGKGGGEGKRTIQGRSSCWQFFQNIWQEEMRTIWRWTEVTAMICCYCWSLKYGGKMCFENCVAVGSYRWSVQQFRSLT